MSTDSLGQPTIAQHPPAYNPQANGAIEKGVQEFMWSVRSIKLGLEHRLKALVDTDDEIVKWIVEHATVLMNRCAIRKDGRTAYRRLYAQASRRKKSLKS